MGSPVAGSCQLSRVHLLQGSFEVGWEAGGSSSWRVRGWLGPTGGLLVKGVKERVGGEEEGAGRIEE